MTAVYLVSYSIEFASTSPYKIVEDEIEIVARPLPPREAALLGVPQGSAEVDIEETIIAEEEPPHVLSTLLSGLPRPSSLLASLATLLINLACVSMVADLTFRGHLFYPEHDLKFVRLGYVSENSARILVREPDVNQLPIYMSVRYADAPISTGSGYRALDNAWKAAGSVAWLSDDTDYTTTFTIANLLPDTRYQYALSNNITGYLITPPPVGHVSQRREGHKAFSFMHTSCIMPRFPYDPRDHPLNIPGFRHLTKWMGELRPAFMMFLGDFIYVDVPRRHGKDVETYRRAYRQVYGSPDYPGVASTVHSSTHGPDYDIPWLHVYDDHEIANDWDANTTGHYVSAFDPYQNYHLSVNPPLFLSTSVTPAQLALDKTLPTWSVFNQGPASFFILDTRRYRHSNKHAPNDPDASMLGQAQLVSLLTWLAAPVPAGVHWKVVFSSVPFTKNWRIGSSDTWANYLPERQRILEAMWTATSVSGIGIIVLSGDRHEFAATAFPPPVDDDRWTPQSTVHEFSASPLNMFYVPVQSYTQTDLDDVCIKYIRDGNSKFGHVEIAAPTGSGQSLLTYRLFVDGEEAWSHVLVAAGGIDGVMQHGRGHAGRHHNPNAIQWVMDEGKWVQHEIEDVGHRVADGAHTAKDWAEREYQAGANRLHSTGDRVNGGLKAGEHYVEDKYHAGADRLRSAEERVKGGLQAGEHYVEHSAQAAAHKAHLAEQAAVGGLFAGWNWFGRKAKAAEHEVTSDAAAAANYAKLQAHKGSDRVRDAAEHARNVAQDEAHHASYRVAHGASAAASNVKDSVHRAEDYAAHQTNYAKQQAHKGADLARDAAGNVKEVVVDEAHHVSYRAAHGASAAASNVKDSVHKVGDFASRQAHAGAYTVSSVSSRASAGLRAGEEYVASQAHEAADAARSVGHAAAYGVAAGEQYVESGVRAGASAAYQGEQYVEHQAKAGVKAGASAVRAGEQYAEDKAKAGARAVYQGEQYVEHQAKAGAAAVYSAEQAAASKAADAARVAGQVGNNIAKDAAHAGHHVAEDIVEAGQHIAHDAKEFGHQVKDDIKYTVPPHHQHDSASSIVEEGRRTASDTVDFMRNKVRTAASSVSSVRQSAVGDEGWTRDEVGEAVAGAVAGAAAMGGVAP